MRILVLPVIGIALGVAAASAQSRLPAPEIRPFAGVSVPAGAQRDLFDAGLVTGLQAALEIRPTFHVVGTFGWTPTQGSFGFTQNDVNIYQYNIGAELGMVRPMMGRWEFRPFVGMGAGGRTYTYEADALSDRTCVAGYGAAGTEFQLSRLALRFEARHNVFCFQPPMVGQTSETRNDLAFALGLAYHLR